MHTQTSLILYKYKYNLMWKQIKKVVKRNRLLSIRCLPPDHSVEFYSQNTYLTFLNNFMI